MTDFELTRLAAKALGNAPETFSPLTDDGDALRLAVKLRMVVDTESMEVEIGKGLKTLVAIKIENDVPLEEATRRAIVRAAAEIGKEMK